MHRMNDNVFINRNVDCDSTKCTRKSIARTSVWPTLQKLNVDVSNFRCQVRLSFRFIWFRIKSIPFNFIFIGDNGTRICGAGKIECYNSAEKNFRLSESLKSFRDHCNCLPACTSVEYDVDVDRTNYLERANLQTASLSIFFGNQQVNTKTRMETYSVSDFLAICGGFLGLLLGISVLSVIELIFHSTLRLLCTIRRSRAVEDTLPFTEREQSTLLTRFFSTTRNFFKELCTESSIHGLRYFTDRALHWSERSNNSK